MKSKLFFIGILASVLLIGCSENEAFWGQSNSLHEIKIEANIHQEHVSRVNDTGFAIGDAIGVYMVDYKQGKPCALANSGNHADNVKFTYGQNGLSLMLRQFHLL